MRKLYFLLLLLISSSGLWAQTQILAPLPAQNSTFSGSVRGYYFVAPTCFTITGMEVPTTASSGAQSIAVVRFPTTPPLYSVTTNVFTTLLLTQNNPATGIIPCNIQVEQGDIIGVLGQRGTVCSYATSGFVSNINGQTMTLNRLGMQYSLTTTAPQELWTESGGSISRVNLYYDTLITYNVTATPSGPSSYTFTDGSDSSFTSVWNYGDGSPLDNVWVGSHNYATPGMYNVCSYVTNTCGTDTVCTTVTVCGAGPATNFNYFSNGLSPTFNDLSNNPVSWAWDFGDGGTSTLQNPTHTYAAPGSYTVCLVSTDVCAISDTICLGIVVCNLPVSNFSGSNNGLTETFTSTSTNATSYIWDFGDGSFATTANSTHTYATFGWYNVCLTVTNGCSESDTLCDSILVCASPVANWNYSTFGNDTVAFANGSTNGTSYAWNFGDGGSDTTANPTHIYGADGSYTVCLIVTNLCGADTFCTTVDICLTPLDADFSFTNSQFSITCTDNSTGASTYSWTFGDGGTSTLASPNHTYSQNGTYAICLTVSNNCGASITTCDTVVINAIAVANALPGFEINVAPNPMQQRTTVLVHNSGVPGAFTFELMDMRGAKVLAQVGQVNEPLTIDGSALAKGMYAFRILQGDLSVGSGRLIVE